MRTLILFALLGSFSSCVVTAAAGDDEATNAKVRTALRAELGTQARFIQIESYGGTVQLSGSVGSRSVGDEAVRAATDVDGVNHVMNDMVPESTSPSLAAN